MKSHKLCYNVLKSPNVTLHPLEKIFEGKLQKYSPLPSRHQNLSTLAGSGGCCMQPAVPLTLLILIFSLGWAGLGWAGLGWAGLGSRLRAAASRWPPPQEAAIKMSQTKYCVSHCIISDKMPCPALSPGSANITDS